MRTLIYKRTRPAILMPRGVSAFTTAWAKSGSGTSKLSLEWVASALKPSAARVGRKVNWIGIRPRKRTAAGKRGPVVTFDHFHLFESDGPSFQELAPQLAHRMYSKNVRVVMVDTRRRNREN